MCALLVYYFGDAFRRAYECEYVSCTGLFPQCCVWEEIMSAGLLILSHGVDSSPFLQKVPLTICIYTRAQQPLHMVSSRLETLNPLIEQI